MKFNGNQKSILNAALKNQLTAINQYFLHARMLNHWGLKSLNSDEYKRSIKAMKYADSLIERILFMEGLPNLQDLGKLFIGEDTEEIIENDIKMVEATIEQLREAIKSCEDQQDYVSRELLESILTYEEDSLDWLETQQWQIENTGIENYTQSKMGEQE
ncbi:bacterioferritin [Cocleimonas flava]|jgi:bacterioferritin|uniref:Bacterioferritin n=1 Tax=Cocleimonas flava TaxID=634765 RepID=A0A4R1EYQ3_9GAMM|nr:MULTISPECIES: bacterioferritin [Cocleimonas]MEB8432734.1 bacterioferritin [Cocleimonas sp. KMM 6892]MEC4715593.1 bacterioferritin [Cocleimonas sp. KMM 6895]MEC4744789.1 bacterioferritin [Cocleimonas sp. KMM 6896]TCJ83161.1 bacterioferritin [Cocleimonas flava]